MAGKKLYVVTPPRGSIFLEVRFVVQLTLIWALMNELVDSPRHSSCDVTCLVDQPCDDDQEHQGEDLLGPCPSQHICSGHSPTKHHLG